jgi:hypothetical protein
MANTFKRKVVATAGAEEVATVYTVPASTTTVIIGFMISNLLANGVEVDIEAASTNLGTNIPIPSGSALSALDGKMVLEAADTVTVACDTLNGTEVILSIMEITA